MIERRCDPACLLSADCAEHAALARPLADRARWLPNRSNLLPDQSLTVRPVELVSRTSSSPSPPPNGVQRSDPHRLGDRRRELRWRDRDVSDTRRRPRRVPRLRCPAAWAHQHATFCAPQLSCPRPDRPDSITVEDVRNRKSVTRGVCRWRLATRKHSDAATLDDACNRGFPRAAEPTVAQISLARTE